MGKILKIKIKVLGLKGDEYMVKNKGGEYTRAYTRPETKIKTVSNKKAETLKVNRKYKVILEEVISGRGYRYYIILEAKEEKSLKEIIGSAVSVVEEEYEYGATDIEIARENNLDLLLVQGIIQTFNGM